MKLRKTKRFEAEVATSSLNDIMFFLLLFFLIVSTIANPSVIKVLLPKADNQKVINKKTVSLTVTKSKEYYLKVKHEGKTTEELVVPADLENAILKSTAGITEPTILLRMDATLSIQDLVDILATGTKIKVRVVMATQAVN